MSNEGRVLTLKVKIAGDAEWIWKAHGLTDKGISVTTHGLEVLVIAEGDMMKERDAYMERWEMAEERLRLQDLEDIEKAVPLPE
jgi:hypothetical protein